MTWFSEIEDKVTNFVKHGMKTDYPNLKVTNISADDRPNIFPTLYIHELAPLEMGQDLDNTTVNAVMSTFEIQVWTDTNEPECKEIMSQAIALMKEMRFNVTMFPNVITENNTQCAIARFRRMIGDGDKLY